jgi:hypothetical protein
LTYLPEFIDESIWLINDIECGNIAKYFDYNNSAAEETLEIISECMPGEKDYPKSSGVLSEEALLNMIKDSCGEYDPTIKDE